MNDQPKTTTIEGFSSSSPHNYEDQHYEFGDLLVSYLELLGIDYAFGLPGGAIEPFVDALARSTRRHGPECIMCRHETGAAFMADGYFAASGKLAVCFATTGPGATNLVTGVASAHANNTPMLVITAQTSLDTFGKGALQESSCTGTNILSIFESITCYNSLVSHAEQLETKLCSAIMHALSPPRGPAHLSIPIDVLRKKAQRKLEFKDLKRLVSGHSLFDEHAFNMFYKLLTESKRTVFVIGNDASEAIGDILQVAVWKNIPLVVTPHGKGLISPYHPLFRGVLGFAGHSSASETLSHPTVDLVVAIGASMGEWASNRWDKGTILNSKLIHVDNADNHFAGTLMARLHLRGDIPLVFEKILEKFTKDNHPKLLDEDSVRALSTSQKMHFDVKQPDPRETAKILLHPPDLMATLPKLFPPNTRYLADSGNSFAWAVHYLHPYDRRIAGKRDAKGGLFKASLDFASMGWAIAAAVGTALALPKTPVVCLSGDGSYLMSGQEVTVAIQHKLPVIYLILNDSAYGMVKHGQRLTQAEQFGYELPFVDFSKLADSLGIPGYVIESIEQLKSLDIKALCQRDGPSILDLRIDPEAQPPIGLRTTELGRFYD